MTSPEGAFYSAEDADSPDPENPSKKREGAFYVWKKSEIEAVLGSEDAAAAIEAYGVLGEGNALTDPHGEFTGRNILYAAGEAEVGAPVKRKLFEARSKRPRPHLDDKVLTDWNGLMIAGLAFASQVLEEQRYAEAAST